MHPDTSHAPGTLYSQCPWRIIPDPPELEALFADAPPQGLAAHENHDFGREPFVWRIDAGILATYAERPDGCRMTALFAAGSHLGAPKALLHRESTIRLSVRTLTAVRIRRTDAVRFRRFLAGHPEAELSWWKTLAASHSALIDGLMINGLEPVPRRLAHLFAVLAGIDSKPDQQKEAVLPIEPTAEELAMLAHATRAVISRQLSNWSRSGIIRREGRKIFLLPAFWTL